MIGQKKAWWSKSRRKIAISFQRSANLNFNIWLPAPSETKVSGCRTDRSAPKGLFFNTFSVFVFLEPDVLTSGGKSCIKIPRRDNRTLCYNQKKHVAWRRNDFRRDGDS